jgi:predicted nucleic acid-binding protein
MKLLLDTNVLLLYLIGQASVDYISDHKRTEMFDIDDFNLLNELIFDCYKLDIVTTPQVLAETSNLLLKGHKSELMRTQVLEKLRRFVEIVDEITAPSRSIINDASFLKLGITDAFLTLLSGDDFIVLSSDAKQCAEIAGRGHRVINFNHEIGRSIF